MHIRIDPKEFKKKDFLKFLIQPIRSKTIASAIDEIHIVVDQHQVFDQH
jgi:hypothetical protein